MTFLVLSWLAGVLYGTAGVALDKDASLQEVRSLAAAQSDGDRETALALIKRLGGKISSDALGRPTQLDLQSTKITDLEVKQLQALSDLTNLDLSRTQVTDVALQHLKSMTDLESLQLYETVITDAGLEHLKGLSKLTFLLLKRTNVTDEGVAKLQRALPNCMISHSPLHPPPSSQILALAGMWEVEFTNGVKQTVAIKEDETATASEPHRQAGGLAGIQAGAVIIAYNDERVERWNVIGERVVVEHWAPHPDRKKWAGHPPLRPLPPSTPVLGIAERKK